MISEVRGRKVERIHLSIDLCKRFIVQKDTLSVILLFVTHCLFFAILLNCQTLFKFFF